ncbi:hypothetical protein Mucpa_2736 [Mucilaginibacter paludis DSM 18603]|uniref:Uncharacterized protein n=1 Tax=Mucilaginibacter paludis DSM 18603 TaxID=714943 RepID=H1Y6Q6_9SPHI|nr:hypothetical protein Mucpa_2736 [Mucilaginibacter paludis DSM 18603]
MLLSHYLQAVFFVIPAKKSFFQDVDLSKILKMIRVPDKQNAWH